MEIRNRRDERDLRGALEVRDRAWRVGYRSVVDGSVIEAARVEPDEVAVEELADELENEAGSFLVADAADPEAAAAGGAAGGAEPSAGETGEAVGESGEAGSGDGEPGPDVVGYVRVRWGVTSTWVDALDAEVVELYVDPARWRDGIGSALLASAVEWTPGTVDGVATEVLAANERGRAFLEASGFEATGTGERTIGEASLETVRYRRAIERAV